MPSFDIVNGIDVQEVDNAVNITKKGILTRFDFRGSKTEITLDKKDKKIQVNDLHKNQLHSKRVNINEVFL